MNSGVLFRAAMWGMMPFLGLGSLSLAQTSKNSAPAATSENARGVDSEPSSTSASFGDWLMRCQRLNDGTETQRVCEVAQQIRAQDQQNPVAEVAIGRLKKTDPLRLTIVLPVNVAFPARPRLLLDGKDVDGLDISWLRCLPGGCYADALLKDDVLRRWKTETGARRITWTDGAGRETTVGLSFRGLTQALDALNQTHS